MTNAKGVDVSNFQGVKSVSFWKSQQFGFAKASEDLTFRDSAFAGNWDNMKAAGIPRGAYHFFHPASDPVAQAKFFVGIVKAAGLEPGDMLVADVELFSGVKRVSNAVKRFTGSARNAKKVQHVPAGAVNAVAKVFLDTVYSLVPNNVIVMVYTNLNVGSTLSSCTNYPLWIANPAASPPRSVAPWTHWKFWQYSFSGPGGSDSDMFNGTDTELRDWVKKHIPQPVPHSGVHKIFADGKRSLSQLAEQEAAWTTPAEVIVLSALHKQKIDSNLKAYSNDALRAYTEPVPKGTELYVW